MLEEKVKVAEEEAQLLARKSREAEEEIRRARESAVKVLMTLCPVELSNKVVNLLERRGEAGNGEESVSCGREISFNFTDI